MDYRRREEIFSKEVLNLQDMQDLLDLSPSAASIKIQDIKRKVGDRLNIKGRLHIQDYLEWLNLKDDKYMLRYQELFADELYNPQERQYDSVCHSFTEKNEDGYEKAKDENG